MNKVNRSINKSKVPGKVPGKIARKTVGLLVLILLFSLSYLAPQESKALSDVTCWEDNCLKNGWTWYDFRSGSKTELACYRDGCEISGWIAQNNNQKYYTQCKQRGCFTDGWYRVDQNTQTLVHNVVCRSADSVSTETDCFKHGWVIYSPGGQEAVISCFRSDCRNEGWLIQTSYELIRVNCKAGGCWQKGWIEN